MKSFFKVIFLNISFKDALLAEIEEDLGFIVRYLPGIVGYLSRYIIYKMIFKKIKSMPLISSGVKFVFARNIVFGKNVLVNTGTYIYAKGGIEIGDNVLISPNCSIVAGNHSWENDNMPIIMQPSKSQKIIIEDDVWIGANSVILGGIVIRKGSVIGAGAVVTKDTEDYSINIGVPAKKIKTRKK